MVKFNCHNLVTDIGFSLVIMWSKTRNTGRMVSHLSKASERPDPISSVVAPNIQFKGFEKVMIKAGETVDVSIDVPVSDLGLWDINMEYVVEPGQFLFSMGSSSLELKANATLTVS